MGVTEPDPVGYHLINIGRWYNRWLSGPLVVVEANIAGADVICKYHHNVGLGLGMPAAFTELRHNRGGDIRRRCGPGRSAAQVHLVGDASITGDQRDRK